MGSGKPIGDFGLVPSMLEAEGVRKWSGSRYILKVQPRRFTEGLNVKIEGRKEGRERGYQYNFLFYNSNSSLLKI